MSVITRSVHKSRSNRAVRQTGIKKRACLATGPFALFGGEGGMIRHCVAHPFGAAVGRSSQQAALLEPGEGSHPPSMGIRFCCATRCKKPTLRSVFQFGGEGGIRTLVRVHHHPNISINFNNLRNILDCKNSRVVSRLCQDIFGIL